MTSKFRTTAIAALVLVSLAPGRAVAANDWGSWDPMGNEWADIIVDDTDPSDFAIDADYDYEPDDLIAFNLTIESAKKVRALGFRVVSREILGNLKLVLVKLRPPFGMNSKRALRALREADPAGFYGFNPIYRLAGAAQQRAAQIRAQQEEQYREAGEVSPPATVASAARATDPRPSAGGACQGLRCYGQALIGWDTQACAMKGRIGIVDSAVDLESPALAGQLVQYKRLNKKAASLLEEEHGTAVAAMLVGTPASGFQGLVPDAELIAADVFSLDKNGKPFTDAAHLALGLDWVASFKPAAVNVSITGPDGIVLRTAIKRMVKQGIAVIAAAGNGGPAAAPQFPAAYPEVIAVTAVDRDLQVYAKANRGAYVALAAPGVGIWTAGEGGAGVFRDGTSFAAPYTTAAVALMRTRDASLIPSSVGAALRKAARDLGAPGIDPVFGAGLVQTPHCFR